MTTRAISAIDSGTARESESPSRARPNRQAPQPITRPRPSTLLREAPPLPAEHGL